MGFALAALCASVLALAPVAAEAQQTPRTVTVDPTSLTMSEAGGTGTYTVVLGGEQPTGDVTISINRDGRGRHAFMLSPGGLTFTPSNWETEQTVTVTAVDDARDNPGDQRVANIVHRATGGGFQGVDIDDVTATATDDDEADGMVVLSESAVTVDEDAGTATYTVVLGGARPTGDVMIKVSSLDTDAATVDQDTLTFTQMNWDTPQTVTVTGVNDPFDNPGDQRTAAIRHEPTGGDYDIVVGPGVTVTVTDDDEDPPGQVTGLTVTPDVGNLTLMWDVVSDADGYAVQLREGSEAWRQFDVTSGSTNSYTFPSMANLEKATVYTVRVYATKSQVGGMPSGEVTERTKTDPPAKVGTPDVVSEVGQLSVGWTSVTNADGYKVQWKSGNEEYDPDTRQAVRRGNDNTEYIIPNLTPTTDYKVRVIATRQYADDGEASDEETGTPWAPMTGQVSGVTPTPGPEEVDLSWNRVTGATGYKVQWRSGSQTNYIPGRQNVISNGATTTHTITGLTGGTEYTIQVIATLASGDGRPSPEVRATPQFPAPGKVGTPTVRPLTRQLQVIWTAVTDADGYKVQWKSGSESYDSDARQAVIASSPTPITHTILNLTAGTEYTVRVISTRDNAPEGEASGEVTGTPYGDPGVIISPTELTVDENGGTASYTVVLAAPPPIGRGATVGLSTVDTSIISYPAGRRSLLFTANNWDDPQTVPVTGVDNDIADPGGRRTETIDHTVQDYGNNLMLPSVTVTVVDDDATPPPPPPPPPTPPAATLVLTPSSIGEDGGAATVTATLDRAAAAEVTLTVSAAPAGAFTLSANRVLTFAAGSTTSTGEVTLTAVDNEEVAPDRTVTVSAAPTGSGVRAPDPVTLTIVDDDLPPPTAALVLTPSTIDENGGVATVMATLDGVARAEVTLTVSAAPAAPAVADDFTLSGSTLTIPAGSTASTGTVTLTAVDNNQYAPDDKAVTVSAAAAGAGVQDPASVTLTITDDDDIIEERDAEMALAGVARGLASGAVNVLGGRFDASPASSARMTLAGHRLQAAEGAAADGVLPGWYGTAGTDPHYWAGPSLDGEPGPGTALSGKDLLLRSSFELPLNASGAAGAPSWTLWGRGAASGFSGSSEPGLDLDGTFYSGYLGMDYRPRPHVLLGLALSHSKGTMEYDRTGGNAGEIDVKLNSVLPYVHWEPQSGLGVWTLVGAGSGDMKVTTEDGGTVTTDLASYLGAAGVRRELATLKGVDLAVKADAFTATVHSKDKADEGIPKVRGNAVRVRAALEGSLDWELDSDSRLTPSLELGGRWDDGTSERGLGAELGGGLAYTHPGLGLSVEAEGRYLLVHRVSSLNEWGASLKVKLDPGAAGRGASLTVAPVWGRTPGGTDGLWDSTGVLDQLGSGLEDAGWTPQRLDVALAYGLPLSRDRGMVTPYSGVTLGGSDSVRYRVGSRLTFGPSLNLTVEGDRTTKAHKPVSHGLSAQLGVRW